jgi:hypothetical protein
LYLWGEQWALFNRVSQSSFRYLFWGVNGAFYLLVVTLLVCEVNADDVLLSSFGAVDDNANVFQVILAWIIITMYVIISIGFLIWGYIQFRRRSGTVRREPLLPPPGIDPAVLMAPPQRSLVGSVVWSPHTRLQRLGTLATACMLLFLVRTVVLILDQKYDNSVPFNSPWFELAYYSVFEVAPISAMCITFFWRPRGSAPSTSSSGVSRGNYGTTPSFQNEVQAPLNS